MIGKELSQQVILHGVLVTLVGALFLMTDHVGMVLAAVDDRQASVVLTTNRVVTRFSSANYSSNDVAHAVVLQADGKIVVAGRAGRVEGNSAENSLAVARYHSDGSLDSSFGFSGKVTTRIGDESVVCALTLQADGKIVVAGSAAGSFALARYQPDGSLDPSFGTGGIVTTRIGDDGAASALVLQADGKIVVAGSAAGSFALARYQPDGSLDPSFGTGGIVTTRIGDDGVASALILQADGKLVVAGSAAGSFALARYQPDGSLDPSFGTGGIVTTAISGMGDFVSALALQVDGKLVVAGYVTMAPEYSIALLRYNPDGTLDTAFGENGTVTTGDSNVASALVLQTDGKIVVVGSFNDGANNEFLLLRYDPDGGLDPTFGVDGKVTTRMSSG